MKEKSLDVPCWLQISAAVAVVIKNTLNGTNAHTVYSTCKWGVCKNLFYSSSYFIM